MRWYTGWLDDGIIDTAFKPARILLVGKFLTILRSFNTDVVHNVPETIDLITAFNLI